VAPASYQQNCGTCHGTTGTVTEGKKAPSIAELQELAPERVYSVLNGSAVSAHASLTSFNELQKRQFAEFTSGRPMNSAAGDSKSMTNKCTANPALANPNNGPGWNGWGNQNSNTRMQSDAAAGLTVQQVPNLKLKWAFGVPNATEMFSQPTVASGRVFFGSDAAWLYSVDAKTGCIYWSFGADAGIRATPVIARIRNQGSTEYAVYFTDVLTRVYAVDAQTGKLLWKTKAGEHPRAKSSNGVAVADGKVFAGFSSMETTTGAVATYECCQSIPPAVAFTWEQAMPIRLRQPKARTPSSQWTSRRVRSSGNIRKWRETPTSPTAVQQAAAATIVPRLSVRTTTSGARP
jgi:polyvinyl alcohol dehydrogenase (cytochrome)